MAEHSVLETTASTMDGSGPLGSLMPGTGLVMNATVGDIGCTRGRRCWPLRR